MDFESSASTNSATKAYFESGANIKAFLKMEDSFIEKIMTPKCFF
jgi:glutaredoxin-related protein